MMKILHLLCHFTISSLSSFLGFSFSIKKSSPVPKMHVLPHKIRYGQPFGKDSTASLPLFLHLPSSFVNMSRLVAELIGWDAGNINKWVNPKKKWSLDDPVGQSMRSILLSKILISPRIEQQNESLFHVIKDAWIKGCHSDIRFQSVEPIRMSVFLLWILTSFRRSPPSFSSAFLSFPQLSSVFLSFCFSLFSSFFLFFFLFLFSFFPHFCSLFLTFSFFPSPFFFLFSFFFTFPHYSLPFLFFSKRNNNNIHSFVWKSKNSFFSSFPSMILFLSFQEKQKAKRWKQKSAQKYLSNNHATNPPSSALALQPSPSKENLTAMNRFLKDDCIKMKKKRKEKQKENMKIVGGKWIYLHRVGRTCSTDYFFPPNVKIISGT